MSYDEFNQFCGAFAGSSYVRQWGNAHVWKVAGKVFAIGGWDDDHGTPAYVFKTSDLNFAVLSEQPGYRPAPYMASRGLKWIQQYQPQPDNEQLRYYISESYRLVCQGLSKKTQLLLQQPTHPANPSN